ncbi:MAG: DedA family protein [Candidatus Woesearchaeota archaeon]
MALIDLISKLIAILSNLDVQLSAVLVQYGLWTYPIIFLVLFLETGDMISAFLPSDSLVFTAGAMAGIGLLNIWVLYLVCVAGVFLGDTANYWLGRLVGFVILKKDSKLLNQTHIERAAKFFMKYGPFGLIIGRYIPFVRTLTPFFGGIGKIPYWKFSIFEAIGASTWVALFLFGGYFFGGLPFVQENFLLIIVLLAVVSFIPIFIVAIKYFYKKQADTRFKRQMEKQYKEYQQMKQKKMEQQKTEQQPIEIKK